MTYETWMPKRSVFACFSVLQVNNERIISALMLLKVHTKPFFRASQLCAGKKIRSEDMMTIYETADRR